MHLAASRALFEQDVRAFSSELARRREWAFHELKYPVIDCSFAASGRTPLRLRLVCDDWNDLPPAITLHASDGSLLEGLLPNPSGVFNASAHPATGRPFVCMRGAREYHTHPSHLTDLWSNIRDSDSYSLGGILHQLWRAWLRGSG
jgi:hypothetical protein